ncbi:MAG: hypothetical protein HND40_12255 [Ignavibacteriota bacterium]|nr:MAG: hypothetical protein HND40_12255 [Ignavibacteriota bacterium]
MRIFWFILFISQYTIQLYPQDFWEQTNGPYGGLVYDLAINSSGHIFAGSQYRGVFRSTDNGENWIPKNNGLTASRIYSITINSSNHIFVGTYQNGVFRSTDNGENWIQINNGIPANTSVNALAISSNNHILQEQREVEFCDQQIMEKIGYK